MACRHNPLILLPFHSCPCRPFRSCIKCWAEEAMDVSELQGPVQCKNNHHIDETLSVLFFFSPLFWVRFFPDLASSRLHNMNRNFWAIAIVSFLFTGALVFAVSINIKQGEGVLLPIAFWNLMFAWYPLATWRYSTPWSVFFTLTLWALTIAGVVLTEVPEYYLWIRWLAFALGVVVYFMFLILQIRIDHYDFYTFYIKTPVIARPPDVEMSVNSLYRQQREGETTQKEGEPELEGENGNESVYVY